ncbi:MAG TPA: cobalamin biosynthesis protein, partial [Mycobacterium sp.]|nr:cobalamin biosynthesis protein [Mycobacterium sp.]
AWRRDAARHPSPNAGVVEAAFAGALGVRLGGPTQYQHELEIRPSLGAGPAPGSDDLRRAVRLSLTVQVAAAALAVLVSAAGRSGRPACPRR